MHSDIGNSCDFVFLSFEIAGIFFVNMSQNKKHFVRSAFCFGRATHEAHPAPHAAGARNPVRIRRPKIGELAHQAQGVRIFAEGEIPGAREEQAPPLPQSVRTSPKTDSRDACPYKVGGIP